MSNRINANFSIISEVLFFVHHLSDLHMTTLLKSMAWILLALGVADILIISGFWALAVFISQWKIKLYEPLNGLFFFMVAHLLIYGKITQLYSTNF